MRRIPIAFAIATVLVPMSGRAGTSPVPGLAPPVDGCDPMDVGPVYDVSPDASAKLACFQLMTPAGSGLSKLDINLAGFRSGELHEVNLIRVDPNGTTHAAASDASTDAYRLLQAVASPSTRWLVMVGRPAASALSPFQLQATVTFGSDRYEPNDAIATATILPGNQRIEANLDNAADTDHYLISVRPDQVQTIVEFEAAPGVGAELIDGVNEQHTLRAGKSVNVNSSRPIFISVRGTETVRSGTRYTLRTRDPRAFAVVSRIHSNENISHLAPGLGLPVPGGTNAARTLQVEATVYEGDGTTVAGAGERVVFDALDLRDANRLKPSWPLASTEATTDDKGKARATLNIGPCRGGIWGPIRVPTRGTPSSYWDITYNPTSILVATIPGNDPPSQPSSDHVWKRFEHVCKEIFRGRRP